jgi:hypothetical protein
MDYTQDINLTVSVDNVVAMAITSVGGPKGDPGATGAAGAPGTTDYTALTNKPTLGTAAATASTDYATSAQGAKADTAVQPATLTTGLATKADSIHVHSQADVSSLVSDLAAKQATLVSGTNIKTINGTTLLGSGDIAIAGGGSGITRSVTVTTGATAAGATALTDYVYIISGAHTVTLPTAAGNTSRYTFKNAHSASVALAFTSAQTADGGGITLAPNASVDLISNNTEWKVI